jgi:hypothetical protein
MQINSNLCMLLSTIKGRTNSISDLVWMGEATTVHSSVIGWAMSTEYKLCFTVTVGIAIGFS